MKNKKPYQYPWRYNNTFEILIDGADYFPAMLNEIKNAKSVIFFEAYLFQSGNTADNFIRELCAARKRDVEIFVLLDEYGSKGLIDANKKTLISNGINILSYNPVNFFNLGKSLKRNHRKLLAIDNAVAFVGGAGITDQFSSEIVHNYWHDVMLKIKGDIVSDLTHSFNEIWYKKQISPPNTSSNEKSKTEQNINKSRVLIAAGAEKNEIIRSVISHIRSSKKRVWLTSPYFISSWKIRRALRYAAKKNVDVRLIFPGNHSDHKWISYGIQRYYRRLLKSKVTIYEFQPRFSHAKIILCDDWFTIGSSNFDIWSQFLNLDINIEVYNQTTLNHIIDLFKEDFSSSQLITIEQWSSRSIFQRTKENLAGLLISILRLISRKFKR